MMKSALITGATGFIGFALLQELARNGVKACVLCRPNSKRRQRLENLQNVSVVEADLSQSSTLELPDRYDVFYHLAWEGGRNNFEEQYRNVDISVKCLELAKKQGCKRFVCTGSQADYGEVSCLITEQTPLNPATAYGSCKVAAYFLTKDLAARIGIEHTWVRIFSTYGKNDNPNTLISHLLREFSKGNDVSLETDASHIWNFIHERDMAEALRLLGKCESSNTVFNLAGNENKPLREFAEQMRDAVCPSARISYGTEKCRVNLNASVDKLKQAINWNAKIDFFPVQFF